MPDSAGLPVRARRTHSLPTKYMIPSEDMGEYESPTRRRSAPAGPEIHKPPVGGGLFPLNEQGEYGQPPKGPLPPPPPYRRRELKPKIYSSYSVDPKCDLHSKKLVKSARDYSAENTRKISSASSVGSRGSTRSSMSPAPERRLRTVSASPSRAPSERSYNGRSSKSPEPNLTSMRKKSNENNPNPRSVPISVAPSQRYSSNSSSFRYRELRDSSFEENDEYQYEENRGQNGIMKSSMSKYSSGSNSFSNGIGGNMGKNVSLDSLRKPKVVSWDSMGILGLSNRMWSETKKHQESFMESTGRFMREETYNSYIM